ncbi:hypothetical protein MPTK1_1g10570 [Marchantia polymorpha subsp. ruderalis]|uniref:Uncharacterized protein n=2 Tax=Marchantia polymorpha TaxID=3197 RepID=A0AAF6ANP7_MARPO|nr:hypothetical protein MARPO_0014s0170 [Marchantia polymorpha]BBM98067.1 hypothetical protein Mp_1g10570 [Marchantia polymorpha subsp. ruderalis]|eukprot:PTQ45659.1 hypothetical protein MARPO_0014s0170 [Marchantia polymorpha]
MIWRRCERDWDSHEKRARRGGDGGGANGGAAEERRKWAGELTLSESRASEGGRERARGILDAGDWGNGFVRADGLSESGL